MQRRVSFTVAAALAVPTLFAGNPSAAADGPSHPEVLIVVNGRNAISRMIGEYYRRSRNVPVPR